MAKAKHRCSACGSTSHRVETCASKAAETIRKLRKQLSALHGGRTGGGKRKRGQVGSRSSHKVQQCRLYTKQQKSLPDRGRCRQFRKQCAFRQQESSLAAELGAVRELVAEKFLTEPSECLSCGAKQELLSTACLQGSRSKKNGRVGALYVRCRQWKCRHRMNILRFSAFAGLKWSPTELKQALDLYSSQPLFQRGRVDGLWNTLGWHRKQVTWAL